jgi:hypothetical protein
MDGAHLMLTIEAVPEGEGIRHVGGRSAWIGRALDECREAHPR